MSALSRRAFLGSVAAAPLLTPAFAAEAKKAAFKLGIVTYNVPKDWDLPTLLKVCQSVGIAAVECRTTHKHGVEPSLSKDERATVKKQFANANIVFWGCGSTCEFHSADAAVVKKNIEECKSFVKLVADLGGRGVKVRPNGVAKGQTPEQACEQIGKALIECGQAAADAGVEIWVEVHGAVTQLPKHMKRMMDVCGHKSVGVTWNSNPTDVVDGKIDEGFELLSKHIKSCHINDLGSKYPYASLFRKLTSIGYDRYTLCEVGKAYDPVEGEKFLRDYRAQWEKLVNG